MRKGTQVNNLSRYNTDWLIDWFIWWFVGLSRFQWLNSVCFNYFFLFYYGVRIIVEFLIQINKWIKCEKEIPFFHLCATFTLLRFSIRTNGFMFNVCKMNKYEMKLLLSDLCAISFWQFFFIFFIIC